MLDSVTKKRIDDLRDILVAKTPSPQSQVEQITTGLIYKFMYDMDTDAIAMGGVPSFFTGDFEKYSWNNLFDPKLSGAEKVELYGDAIEKMYNNPSAPTLFREIFKNSYLPFKDSKILNMFLKEIDEFHYSDSETLGDAYEYLVSFLGSQGDAGQFRTPRHIIDFIVDLVSPQKNETILDPASGTAGFLVSSYKHILTQNTEIKFGDRLTAAERRALGENIVGYELDPTFVKIALVNLHLHQFSNPKIFEYDTLSSDDRWNDYFDVILANPPFMTPKGGIQPHSKFGVQSKKAEVLFVDYILSHLKPEGRAGIVVPEGIIFNPDSAFKSIRKKLLSDGLIGVISLPAGVFNPYSDNKTSILVIDKKIAKDREELFFAKVESDGYSLGKNRKKQGCSDLPNILNSIQNFLYNKSGATDENLDVVSKDKILAHKSYSLVVGNYVLSTVGNTSALVKVGEIAEVNALSCDPKKLFPNGSFTYIDIGSVQNGIGKVSLDNIVKSDQAPSRAKRLARYGDTLVSTVRPNLKGFAYVDFDTTDVIVSTGFLVLTPNSKKVLPEYLYHCITSDHCVGQMIAKMERGNYPSINQSDIKEIQIPLISLDEQQSLLEEITKNNLQIEEHEESIESLRQKNSELIDGVWVD